MRFIEGGPDIPNELLEARDNGEVVFLCGAGVSMPVGLPSFQRLTEAVCSTLGANSELQMLQTDTPYDQVFSMLKRDFGNQAVMDAVSKETRTPRNADTKYHKALLTLSSGHDGKARLVTTNFDLLFENANRKLSRYVSPVLPDFRVINDFEGLVYLHGRITSKTTRPENRSQLILSSAEFGHAYLSQGWAADFIRELLQRYTVVLIGYSADDPPVRYLLEGLALSDRRNANKLYSFAAGIESEVIAHWRERNTTAIPYSNGDGEHSMLWETLMAWAERARSPSDWRENIARTAITRPSKLTAVQRGQIAALVSTADGAKAFANNKPSPHPEWICVFDRAIRMADLQKESAYLERSEFDPQQAFGIDSDPPRIEESNEDYNTRKQLPRGVDVLSTFPDENQISIPKGLTNTYRRQTEQLPQRLWHLVRWIADHSFNPTIIWWLARQNTINQELIKQIKWKLEHSNVDGDQTYHQLLDWLLEVHETESWDRLDRDVIELKKKLVRTCWNASSLRDLKKFLNPKLVAKKPLVSNIEPPTIGKNPIPFYELVRFEIKYPDRHNSIPEIPKKHLAEVVGYACQGLFKAAQIIDETGQIVLGSPTFILEDKPGRPSRNKGDNHLLWVGELFHKLCKEDPIMAKREFYSWPVTEMTFLDKLNLYALSHDKVFSSSEVAKFLSAMGETPFWFEKNRRDLLFLIRNCWKHFNRSERRELLLKVLSGPEKWKGEKRKDYVFRRAFATISILEWLQTKDCQVPKWALKNLEKIRKDIPDWQSEWVGSAVDSREGRGGYVRTDPSHDVLNRVPLGELVEKISEYTKRPFAELTDYRPFQGIVKDELSRAISLLGYESRKGRYPVELWREAISSWPETSFERQRWLFAYRLSRLPKNIQFELRYYHVNWLQKELPALAKLDRKSALSIWDHVYEAIAASGAEATKSARGFSYIGGKQIEQSKRTFAFASGPASDLAEILLSILSNIKRRTGKGIPKYIKDRLEKLWKIPGEGADYAVSRTTMDILWLERIDPQWVSEKLLPMLDLENNLAEPAWSGVLYQSNMFHQKLFQQLKPNFLNLGRQMQEWKWSEGEVERYAQFAVLGCWWHMTGTGYLSWVETRNVLKTVSDTGRSSALRMVSDITSEHDAWSSFGKTFFEKAWPRELSFQTGPTSYNLVRLAEEAGDQFPDVVKSISQFVYPPEHADLFVFKMKKELDGVEEEGSELATRYPNDVLMLLDRMIPEDEQDPPYDLASLINMIAKANPALRQDRSWLRLHRLSGG